MFQSTHPRGVRPPRRRPQHRRRRVSIHAPARGATRFWRKGYGPVDVSIHAPARGATHGYPLHAGHLGQFQSTHPRGVRPALLAQAQFVSEVSIHAPARGATSTGVRRCADGEGVSIHAPARGATAMPLRTSSRPARFQSTHPRGVRPGRARWACSSSTCFNPRTRAGCDLAEGTVPADPGIVSIHAPARGATLWVGAYWSQQSSFNPRTRAGCDLRGGPGAAGLLVVSIHAPARGATGYMGQEDIVSRVSIHAPARGATRAASGTARHVWSFNPRTRAGCDPAAGPVPDRR